MIGIYIIVGLLFALVAFVSYLFGEYITKNKLEPQIYHDPLTGLYNRNYFEANRDKYKSCYVTIVDIDDLKTTNDALGHEAGDQRILYTAAVISMQEGTAFRLGGDEFLLVSDDYPEELAYQLKFASFGTMFKDEKISIADAMRDADKNMYNMKHSKEVA